MRVEDADMIYRGSGELARVYRGSVIVWEPGGGHDYSQDYFTLEVLTGGTFVSDKGWYYSINGGEWEFPFDGGSGWTLDSNTYSRYFNAGDVIRMKGTSGTSGRITTNNQVGTPCGMVCNVYGNIMSVVYGDNFSGQTNLGTKKFEQMFYRDDLYYYITLHNAENLVLPATVSDTGTTYTYESMFANQAELVYPPKELPLQTATTRCYAYMFKNCSALKRIPKIKAVRFTSGGWNMAEMFSNCDSLTSATIYQTALTGAGNYCMQKMFEGCSQLADFTCYLNSRPSLNNISGILDDVSASGTVHVRPGVTWWQNSGELPSGWTVAQDAPSLG